MGPGIRAGNHGIWKRELRRGSWELSTRKHDETGSSSGLGFVAPQVLFVTTLSCESGFFYPNRWQEWVRRENVETCCVLNWTKLNSKTQLVPESEI
jgi:hypothetical protein